MVEPRTETDLPDAVAVDLREQGDRRRKHPLQQLDWTVVHPTRLTHGPAKGTYRAENRLPMKGNPTIGRADVAAFIHGAAHGGDWIHRTAVISD